MTRMAAGLGILTLWLAAVAPAPILAQLSTLNEISLAGNGLSDALGDVPAGGPEAVAFDGTHIWVAEQFTNTVTRIDRLTGLRTGTFAVGTRPVALLPVGNTLWVANLESDTLTRLRTTDGAALGTVQVGDGPGGLAFDGTHVWVAHRNRNSVSKLSLTGAVVATFQTGRRPMNLRFNASPFRRVSR